MGQKRHTPEQIIRKLREAEVEIARGQTAVEAEGRRIPRSPGCAEEYSPPLNPIYLRSCS
jgi:hypothetical protein